MNFLNWDAFSTAAPDPVAPSRLGRLLGRWNISARSDQGSVQGASPRAGIRNDDDDDGDDDGDDDDDDDDAAAAAPPQNDARRRGFLSRLLSLRLARE